MKVLRVCFIKFMLILNVFAFEQDDLYAVPDTVVSEVLHLNTAINNQFVADTLFSSDINEYWLYSSKNPTEGQLLVHKDEESIKNSCFDINKKTLIQIHGWLGDHKNPLNQNISRAVFSSCDAINWNIIRLDWSKQAKSEYMLASAAVRKVGEYLCDFLKWLTTLGLLFSKTVLIGQSLGAHVAGFTGRTCDCKIAMIQGTDPAGPGWATHPGKLSENDAVYVAVTHSSLFLGDYENLMGHADFYPNGGKEMDTCGSDFRCNHDMAARYWCASWYYPDKFVAKQCASMDNVENDTCNGEECYFGRYNIDYKPKGIFRFNTEIEEFPYMVVE